MLQPAILLTESRFFIVKLPNFNSDVQVETDIQRGVVELYYDTLKAMDVDSVSDSDADSI